MARFHENSPVGNELMSAHENGPSVAPWPGPRNCDQKECALDRSDSPNAVTMKYWRFRSAVARSCTIFQVAPALKYANHIKQGTMRS
eukprot:scaffold33979_cov96-Attheya_sp.AAC.6